MRRVIVWAAKLAVIGVLAMIGTGTFDDDAGQSDDSAKIQTYKAVFDVAKDGRTQVTETLQVEFPESKHGIFRFFDTWDAPNPKARLIPTNISVTRDGMVEPWELLTQDRGRFKVVKIGSPIVTMTGVHTYKISYQVEGALIAGGKQARSLFYWDLIPGGWAMPIAKADLRVNLPAELSGERCIAGTGKYFACSIEADSATSLRVQASDLAPFVPVTVQAGVDIATPSVATKPWPSHLDPLFGKSVPVAFVVGLLALASGLAGLWLVRARSEKEPPFPLSYAPPEGISPGQAAYLLEEVLPTRAFIGSLLYAAERGAITMTQDGEKLVISTVGDGSAWDQLDVPTQGIAAMLSLKKEGATFTLDPKSAVASGKMQDAIRAFRGRVENWGKEAQLIGPSRLGVHGPWLLLATFVLTAALLLFAPWNMALLGLVPGMFWVFGTGIGASGGNTKRTPAGRDLWARVGGFKRVLATPSAEDRFDFSGRNELYSAYIPWAVAFDCAKEWAAKYEAEIGAPPPPPYYIGGDNTGASTALASGTSLGFLDSMTSSFDSAASAAISNYSAGSSSFGIGSSSGGGGGGGGGGGFRGGGGGGGGGGGSW
ncbi:MAG: DUF2207 domain-containing protein [Nocardioidaceae bacterium]|nr:DUF2207 domain-containing protein [Nocardioidaceae bacterium]